MEWHTQKNESDFSGFHVLGSAYYPAQDSLEELQKRKTIAETERATIEAETARDEARKIQSELVAPPDPVKMKTKDDAVEAAKKAQSGTQSLCMQCIKAAQDELRKCLDAAISQEDKGSCLEKQETRAKTCDNSECKLERAQRGSKSDVPSEKK